MKVVAPLNTPLWSFRGQLTIDYLISASNLQASPRAGGLLMSRDGCSEQATNARSNQIPAVSKLHLDDIDYRLHARSDVTNDHHPDLEF